MGGQPQTDRLFEPEQMIDLATNILNHMRLQHDRNEERAVNATLFVLTEALAWMIVKSSATEGQSIDNAVKLTEHLADVMNGLNSVRDGAGVDLPRFAAPEYAETRKRGRA